jgi:glycosyltransferase involved in cell wall biosynthesis
MTERGHRVTLLSLSSAPGNDTLLYPLHRQVRHLAWDNSGRHEQLRRLRERLQADGADVFLSMQSSSDHLLWSMVCMGSGIPFICSERCDPVRYTEQRVWNRPGRLAVLSGADVIHELLPSYAESVPSCFKDRVRVIPNAAPVDVKLTHPEARPHERPILLFLARFDGQKRPLLLIDAFRMAVVNHPEWELHMWGHGPLEKAVRARIARCGLEAKAHMRGECKDTPAAYAEAQLYCLPSAYEGLPNTALEAMSAGLPVVGFKECAGIREVVREGETGLVVAESTPEALARALDALMGDGDLRWRMGQTAMQEARTYNPEAVNTQWESLFMELAAKKGHTVMDAFFAEPFASRARLSAAARREWLFRNFGEPMPYGSRWFLLHCATLFRNAACHLLDKLKTLRGPHLPGEISRAGKM